MQSSNKELSMITELFDKHGRMVLLKSVRLSCSKKYRIICIHLFFYWGYKIYSIFLIHTNNVDPDEMI